MLGQCLIHTFNVVSAEAVTSYYAGMSPCRHYLICILTDLFLLAYSCRQLLKATEWALSGCPGLSFRTGNYGVGNRAKQWAYQLLVWLVIVFFVFLIHLTLIGKNRCPAR